MKVSPHNLQLALIEADPPSDVFEPGDLESIAWSYSRRGALESCARRYYFEYYGASKRAAPAEPGKNKLRTLKDVSNRHLRAGEILHENIAWFLRDCQRGMPPDADRLVARARHQFAADREYSMQYVDSSTTGQVQGPPPVLLQEYLYRRVDADQLCDEAETKLRTALSAFANDPRYLVFHLGASTSGALIERQVNFRPDGVPCRVMGKIDLAYGGFETATLVDWKLGQEDGSGDDSLQLAVYALWAIQHYGCDHSSIRICKAHLGSGDIVDFSMDDLVLTDARARIVQDAIRMADVHPYGRAGIAEAFTPCAKTGICRGCSYLQVCPDGRSSIHA